MRARPRSGPRVPRSAESYENDSVLALVLSPEAKEYYREVSTEHEDDARFLDAAPCDFFELLEYSIGRGIGVKFSTNGAFIDAAKAKRLTEMDYLDIQISLDGTDAVTNDAVRGEGSYDTAITAMQHLQDAGFGEFKISVVITRHNVDQLDEFKALADEYGAQLRITRLRPSGRGADSWHDLHPTQAQQRQIYDWLVLNGRNVLTGDSFFHLNALGEEPLPGLNM